jgi:hypothetical protein
MGEWQAPLTETIPDLLKSHARWLLWSFDGAGKKAPRDAKRVNPRSIDATKPINWSDWDTAYKAQKSGVGLGFALGAVQDGPNFAGIDLDHCRDPITGRIDGWAKLIIQDFNSYTEISPSGTGVKIFLIGTLPSDNPRQGKIHKIEIYDRGRYFTVTGQHLEGTPKTIEPREERLRALHSWVWSRDLVKLVKLFNYWISDGNNWINIRCPWAEGHSGTDQPRDAGFHLTDGKIDGFSCFHASCSERTLGDVRQFFGIRGGDNEGFRLDQHDRIVPDDQENIRHAVDLLGVKLSYDNFCHKPFMEAGGIKEVFSDANTDRLWLLIDERFKFRPGMDFFQRVLNDAARRQRFHPVKDYLAGLVWDGKPRIDDWLVTYGGAKPNEYVSAVGTLVLVAAVRRIKDPGCKFDELLILESGQGFYKSTALKTLCPNVTWFSDDLPLNVDAKQIIERTAGKWIIEAAELSGSKSAHSEHLKAFLSRQVDGPARLAYARNPVEVPRCFMIIGTTNSYSYLKDSTGGRRFWPVYVPKFDIEAMARDRDQLWAEAVVREAQGVSIRLAPYLWEEAGKQQENRRIEDPWEVTLGEAFPDDTTHRVDPNDLWDLLQVPIERRTRELSARLSDVMTRLGFRSLTIKKKLGVETKVMRGWGRDPKQGKIRTAMGMEWTEIEDDEE